MVKLTKKQQEQAIHSLIESGELDLGFCKIIKKKMGGGTGRGNGGKLFKKSKYNKLVVELDEKFKYLLK